MYYSNDILIFTKGDDIMSNDKLPLYDEDGNMISDDYTSDDEKGEMEVEVNSDGN